MLRVLTAEVLKLRRARAVWGTGAIVASFALLTISMSGLGDASSASRTWEAILGLGAQFMAAWWGLMVYGLAAAMLFGSEFSDGTASSMLTAPVRRESFVAAKMMVLALWVVALVVLSVLGQSLAALLLDASGFGWSAVFESLGDSLLVALMIYLTLPAVALIAMLGRGYIAPMLYSTGLATMSMTAGFLGWERWIPWAMPLTVAGGIAPPGLISDNLPAGSWALLTAFFLITLAAVFVYVNRVDSNV